MLRLFLVAASLLFAVAPARAQMLGSCTGGSAASAGTLSGDVGIAFFDDSGNPQSVQAASIGFVFNGAECFCATDDLMLDIFLRSALNMDATGTVEVWVGQGCETATPNRTLSTDTTCEEVAIVPISQFIVGSTSSGAHVYIPIPARSLFSPDVHQCKSSSSSTISVFVFAGDKMSPSGAAYATCTLNTPQQLTGPSAPISPDGSGGDEAVTISWTVPTTNAPFSYQVLCADVDGNPIKSSPNKPGYSVCGQDGKIQRRELATGGSLGVGDGGVSTTSIGTNSVPGAPSEPAEPRLHDVPDSGVPGVTPTFVDVGDPALGTLDHKFICSDVLGTASNSTRISGLTNGTTYRFLVVGIDKWGNATPASEVIEATPQPVEDLYSRYRNEGGTAEGFCEMAASGAPEIAALLACALAILMARRLRRQ